MIWLGNLGGIVGSYIFIESESPKHPTGFGSSLAFAAAGVGACGVLEMAYKWKNKKRDAMSESEVREKYTDEELKVMGDMSPWFQYTL